MKKKRKGLGPIMMAVGAGVGLVVLAIVLSIGAAITEETRDTLGEITDTNDCGVGNNLTCATSTYAYNITDEGLEGLDTLGSWQGTMALAVAAVVVLALIFFLFRQKGGWGAV